MTQPFVLIFSQIHGFIPSFIALFWSLVTPPLQLADGPEYEVASILDSKIVRSKLYYLVDWARLFSE
jgi:hypothetical protein